MKNNRTFFAIIVLMLSAQSFASAPAQLSKQLFASIDPSMPEQIEGQPRSMPSGGISFSSSSALVKIYKDQETQTAISAQDDEQVTSQVCHVISLNNIHALTMKCVNNVLQSIQAKAESGNKEAIAALALFNQFVCNGNKLVDQFHEGCSELHKNSLLEACRSENGLYSGNYCLNSSIIEAFKAKNLLKK